MERTLDNITDSLAAGRRGHWLVGAAWYVGAAAVITGGSMLLDKAVWRLSGSVDPAWMDTDGQRLLRGMGFVPLWLLAGVVLVLHDWPERLRRGWPAVVSRGALLAGSVLAAGAASEIAKALIRRERPTDPWDGVYRFRPWSQWESGTGNLGTPSGHVLVAFAATWALCRLFPRGSVVWVMLGAGCAATRLASRAHVLSDVVLAAVLAWGVVWLMHRMQLRLTGRPGRPT